jgi:hypothetical protein
MQMTFLIVRADQAESPYFYVPFDIPEGTTRLDVAMRYRKADDCIIDLGLLDCRAAAYPSPDGFRGWSGGARQSFFVATDDATPGYVHGPMPVGRWNVMLGLYRVPEGGAAISLEIDLDNAPRPTIPQAQRHAPKRLGAGWYRGDLHAHTFHSDAAGSPELLHAAAKQAGLDFLAVTDHNTTSQRCYFNPASSPELVFVRGMEVTTAIGHANVFGVDDWIDFRMTKRADAHTLATLVHDRSGLLSINHDKPTIPSDYDLPAIDCMEAWQSSWFAWNWISLARYQQRLASGLRPSLIGGSDYHQPDRLEPEGPFVLGRPTTALELDELSEDAILSAMKAGRGYVTESPTGPHLAITVDGAPMGSAIAQRATPRGQATVRGAAGDMVHWIDASGIVGEQSIDNDDWRGEIAVLKGVSGFLRAEIVAEASRARLIGEFKAASGTAMRWGLTDAIIEAHPVRRALSNPIYFAP